MKKFVSFILALVMVLSISACSTEEPAPAPEVTDTPVANEDPEETPSEPEEPAFEGAEINIGVLKGPTGMGAAWLMEENEQQNTVNTYNFTVAGAADELTGQLIQGGLDIAALPTNAISSLYNKTEGKIVCLGINTLGVLYILENGESISSIADLEGKTILASGKGSTAEAVLNHLLAENNVTAEIYWASEHAEAATLALTEDSEYDIVMLPEPFVTNVMSKTEKFRVALDLSAEWEAVTGGILTMGGFAIRKDFLEQNPEAVAEFINDYAESVANINEDPAEAGVLIEKFGIAAAAVAEKAVPRCNMVWIANGEYQSVLEAFLTVLYEGNPASVGGKMPEADFYN